jgi:hypothetical protein
MNSKDWHKGFETPSAMGAGDVAWLEQAVASFPYSAALHALYAKALKNENHYLAPQALRKAAVVSPNRRALLVWMEGAEFETTGQSVPRVSPEVDSPIAVEAPSELTDVRFVHEGSDREAAQENALAAELHEQVLPIAPEVPVSNWAAAPVAGDDLSHLPEKVREAILRSRAITSRLHPQDGGVSPSVPVQHAPPPAPPTEVRLAEPLRALSEIRGTSAVEGDQEVVGSHEEVRPDFSLDKDQDSDRLSDPGPKEPEVKAHSPFAQWLAQQTGHSLVPQDGGAAALKSEETSSDPATTKEMHGSIPENPQQVQAPHADDTAPVVLQPVVPQPLANALIDKFLEREAPVRPNPLQRQKGDLPEAQVDLSASSLGGDPVFMTETLAQLYLQQGAFDKAVQAYEILRLKYPEKSAIFAAQILEIRLTQRNKKP